MTTYSIIPERSTLHGSFSSEFPPVLTIASGDRVQYRTLDAGWNIEQPQSTRNNPPPIKFTPRDTTHDTGHALCGPIAIIGAEPGMTLAIHLNEIRPARWGWNAGGGGWKSRVNDRLGVSQSQSEMHLWELDATRMVGRNNLGFEIDLHPFMGILGMPPAEPGLHSTIPPRATGGNMDCKELVAGSTVYLPIAVTGGLFSLGDGHAAQGDGEVSTTAIECPMDLVDVTFELLPDLHIALPRANTPAGWVTLAFDTDLHEASMVALEGMLDLMQEIYTITREDALALASVVVDIHVTQVVNGDMLGAHAVLPHTALRR